MRALLTPRASDARTFDSTCHLPDISPTHLSRARYELLYMRDELHSFLFGDRAITPSAFASSHPSTGTTRPASPLPQEASSSLGGAASNNAQKLSRPQSARSRRDEQSAIREITRLGHS